MCKLILNLNKKIMKEEELTSLIIGAAYEVHNFLGSGFLEKVYHNAMVVELENIGLNVNSQCPIKVHYKEKEIGEYYADLLVENKVIVEFKAIENIHPIHEVQLVNYLHATKIDVGLLINFGNSVTVKRKFRKLTPR
jgi:GxxExxY protein